MRVIQDRHLILDVDCGVDDALAIMLALSLHSTVEAVTCVAGNTTLSNVYSNVRRVLRVCGMDKIPVYRGCERPLTEPLDLATEYHGHDGLGEVALDYPAGPDGETSPHASQVLVQMAKEAPGKFTLLLLGPHTNAALALLLDPQFGKNLRDIFIMGGNIKGNLVLNSVFLHGDLAARPYRAPDFRDALSGVIDRKDIIAMGQYQIEVQLTLRDDISVSKIPHLLTIYGCQSLLLIPGRPPLCLRCNRVGHIRRQCRTPRCTKCQRYGHSLADCVLTYADRLKIGTVDESATEHLMDASEVVEPSGDIPMMTEPPDPTLHPLLPEQPEGSLPSPDACTEHPASPPTNPKSTLNISQTPEHRETLTDDQRKTTTTEVEDEGMLEMIAVPRDLLRKAIERRHAVMTALRRRRRLRFLNSSPL
ncbi:inosine-uridine preferring nucleoside hydrolase [Ixodes scapularis]